MGSDILTRHEINTTKGIFDSIVKELRLSYISSEGLYLLCGCEHDSSNSESFFYALCAISKNYPEFNPKILLSATRDDHLGIIFLGVHPELNRNDDTRKLVVFVEEEMQKYLPSRIELARIEED